MIDEFGRMMGKDFSVLKNKLRENDINTVSELATLSDADLTELGFTVGLRAKLRKFLAERESGPGGMQSLGSFTRAESIQQAQELEGQSEFFAPDQRIYVIVGNEDYSARR